MTNLGVERLSGPRAESLDVLEILDQGVDITPHEHLLAFNLERMYPREMFEVAMHVWIPAEHAEKLTLRIYRDNQGRSFGFCYASDAPPISLAFYVKLSRIVDNNYETTESFTRGVENIPADHFIWLYP